ncbi:protein phosphatase [Streptomyces abyssalis]|uniref:protein-serine/threonine phosphatase n=1 Tax=Streptomyces abyssalis TaxID=933944 RepID=A0A1E7JG68_9ACTN|nr:protein phosphatase [Streptomyces abyssalis]OEU93069.1 protein phosphatase [Streptomyces abyssalis]OEV27251.1 protein phosphatase [Streptomyces nanshensis]
MGGVSTGPSEGVASILDTLRVGTVMLDGKGKILLWNPMTEEILGWRADQVVGSRIQDFLEDGYDEGERLRDEALRNEGRWRGSMRILHSDGHRVAVEGRVTLLHDTQNRTVVIANIVETSRIRAVEHDLAALDALFASSPLGIALFDKDKRFVRVNESLARLNQLAAEEHTGRTVHDVLPSWMAEEVSAVQSTVLETGEPLVDVVMPAPEGPGSRSVSYSRLTTDKGEVLGVSTVFMDITERREALEKIEAARERLALLDDVGVGLADRFDVTAISQALASSLVPRLADYAGVMLIGAAAHGGDLPDIELLTGTPLFQLGVAARHEGPTVNRMLRVGQDVPFLADSFFGRTLASGVPHIASSPRELLAATYPGDPKMQAALDLKVHSLMAVPLRARGVVLGLLVVSRAEGREQFGRDDIALAMELADRAGVSLDNARLYARERAGALMLQRSLLPQKVPEPPGVQVAYRYVPGSSGTEVGGDWFDVIPLAGGRVAFVVGDVMGHGLHAAVTMGRLRTAVRTLAGLDLPPDELLRRINDLADDFVQTSDDPLIATCVYAVYDPSTRRCSLAKAGHPPPLLLTEAADGSWVADTLELPSGAPLGVGGVPFETFDLEVVEGSVLILYTDGLIEARGEDITQGIDRLCGMLSGGPARRDPDTPATLEAACDSVIDDLESRTASQPNDDVALLMAKLGGLPQGSAASWTFPAESYAVRRAREVVRRTLHEWGLDALEDTTVLLVSELATNSMRYAHGPIGVRMVRGSSLLVEVSDPLPDPPRERSAMPDDEGGRGIRLVAREARRWGTRHGPMGKTVWFELALP